MPRHLLVLADSLAFHGPSRPQPTADPRLYPNVAAAHLGRDGGQPWVADVLAGLGWTARDGWWALTRDPRSWGELIPRAEAMVVGLGGMDQLPAALPTYLREGIAYLRPGAVRREARRTYQAVAPAVMRATAGRLRQLPQRATDTYLTRSVEAVRFWRPGIPVVALAPSPYRSQLYPVDRGHAPAVLAARNWAGRTGLRLLEIDDLVWPGITGGTNNPDGLHWGWDTHERVGRALAAALEGCRPESR